MACSKIILVSSLSPALFWQDKAEARRWQKKVTGIRQEGGREGGRLARKWQGKAGARKWQLLEGKLPEGRLRQGQLSRCRWRGKRLGCFLLVFPRCEILDRGSSTIFNAIARLPGQVTALILLEGTPSYEKTILGSKQPVSGIKFFCCFSLRRHLRRCHDMSPPNTHF